VAKQTGRDKVVAFSMLDDADLNGLDCGPLDQLFARDIMFPLGAQVRSDCTINQAAHLLVNLNLDALPVLGEAGRIEGFICDQDLMARLLDSCDESLPVARCRPSNVATFEESVPAMEIAKFLSRTGVQRVVVVRHALPVGVISRRGLLRWLLNVSLRERAGEDPNRPRIAEPCSSGVHRSIGELQLGVARLAKIRDAEDDEQIGGILVEATRIQESPEKLLRSCGRMQHRQAELVASGATIFG
jgi:CBS domain-containing protein